MLLLKNQIVDIRALPVAARYGLKLAPYKEFHDRSLRSAVRASAADGTKPARPHRAQRIPGRTTALDPRAIDAGARHGGRHD